MKASSNQINEMAWASSGGEMEEFTKGSGGTGSSTGSVCSRSLVAKKGQVNGSMGSE